MSEQDKLSNFFNFLNAQLEEESLSNEDYEEILSSGAPTVSNAGLTHESTEDDLANAVLNHSLHVMETYLEKNYPEIYLDYEK